MKEIIIDIPLDGIASGNAQIKTEAHGIKGSGCVNTTKKLMKDVAEEKNTSKTDEYFQPTEETENVRL